ncbi:MAG: P-loop NTPase [Actinobacteria bacterium]|nr:P-loop NTPase [Actinomycetota bacterium]
MSRIVLASQVDEFEVRIRAAYDNQLDGHLRRWGNDPEGFDADQVTAELTHDGPDVVALGPDVETETALRLARTLDRDRPEVTVMLVTKPTGKLWERAMKAGVSVILSPEAEADEIREELDRALDGAERRRDRLTTEADPASRAHRVIVVTAPKGGAGKSVVATNLAVGLAQAAPEQVVLVDLDLQFGDVAGALQMVPEHTIVDAVRSPGLDLTTVKVFLTSHPTGCYALCAPETPADADEVTPELAASIIDLLSQEFRYVVVDTSSGIGDHALAAFEVATDFVLVGAMDVAAVRALRKQVDVLDQLGLVRPPRHFVLNRSDSRVGLNAPDVEATVGLRIDVSVPSSRAIPVSFNQGAPVVQSDPRAPVARELMKLVERFAHVPATDPGRRRPRRR